MTQEIQINLRWCSNLLILALLLVTNNSNALDTPTVTSTSTSTSTNSSSTVVVSVKGGRCPEPKMDQRLCTQGTEAGDQDQCTHDAQCSGESICCSTGCSRVCMLPGYTACEQVRSFAERRARSLKPEDASLVPLPECDPATGSFRQVQCSQGKGCFCVDAQGFELPGTRASSLELVNCSKRNPKCQGPTCRMLCHHGFELDSDGCEICECRNVCSGVKCPGDLQCEVEEPPCTTAPCPPLPSCKQPRSLDSLCPFGAPLTIPELGSPFLCGSEASGPPCPAAFQCNVGAGNDYGVCCAANKNFDKPGNCPVVGMTMTSEGGKDQASEPSCPSGCRHDLDCADFDKCCFTKGCGKQCSKPSNSTVCLQQKHIAELLSGRELEGKGYIPQCDDQGNFTPKQCSRNGKVCWCVSSDGKNFAQSLGPSDSVNCTSMSNTRQRAALRSDDSTYTSNSCDPIICPPTLSCEYGFKTDRNGCPSCDCMESPCAHLRCPSGSGCVLVHGDSSTSTLEPTCLSDSLFVNPCPLGSPLTHALSAQVVACSQSAPTCPSSHICVLVAPNKAGLCCPNSPRLEPTKPGMCPFLAPSLCSSIKSNNSLELLSHSYKKCGSDSDCENSMKCCAAGDCTVCADPLLHQDIQKSNPTPTMCEYLRNVDTHVDGTLLGKFRLAKGKPQCKDTGEFSEVQCDSTHCMCVDEHGAEIPGTMVEKLNHNLTTTLCLTARHNPKCLEMNCRLACDYGYEALDGCKICECRNPCMFKHSCHEDEQCEMVDIDCVEEHCPPLPFCVPKALAALASSDLSDLNLNLCPKGSPYRNPESNVTLSCSPRARMLQCPDDYFCSEVVPSFGSGGLCCPIVDDGFNLLAAEERGGLVGPEDLNLLFGDHSSPSHTKPGQCPYLLPFHPIGGCESDCETDDGCSDASAKCCLNSCGGSQCIQPLLLTACQHQKSILEHKARESGLPSRRLSIPECDGNGYYVRIQSFSGFNWCVDSAGEEIQGTRVPSPQSPNCQKPSQCPQTHCSLQCEFGLSLNQDGCPLCQCRPSPCEQVGCSSRGEECRMVQLNCISEPCPPVPLCLPRLDNPCPFGAPLSFEESGDRVSCGGRARNCPASHKCNISPFGEYAVCCPKPKEVCFEPLEEGNCKAITTKWFFNTSANECQPFAFTGCGGNNNQFNSKAECLSVCPALTHCERMREKNSELVSKYGHMSYIPKCDPRTGEWESIQCLEEVGMCWCVDKKKGTPLKGTMTNGMPNCAGQLRRGRMLSPDSPAAVNPNVCDAGVTVHKCSKSTCENKICLGHPDALCMVNPCGGCSPKWVTSQGQPLDCSAGLGLCHKEMQQVMNSAAWINQGFSAASAMIPDNLDMMDDHQEQQQLMDLGPFGSLSELLLRAQPRSSHRSMRKMGPVFTSFGDGVMGIMSGSVTFIGDSSSEEESIEAKNKNANKPPRRTPHSSPVKSIADILADLMTSGSNYGLPHPHPGYLSDDLADLMPSSSGVRRSHHHMMPDFGPLFTHRVRRDIGDQVFEDSLAMESISSSEEQVVVPFPITSHNSGREMIVSILPSHTHQHAHSEEQSDCPSPSPFALLSLLSGACGDECNGDQGCPQGLKCCLSGCGLRCIHISGPSASIVNPAYEAVEHELESPTMVVSLPECDTENGGYYSPVQSHGELSWCVSPEGEPIPDTITRGKVLCSSNGTLLDRWMKGPVCPHPHQNPNVCKNSCLHSSCPLHPDAVCVMDVCDECKPSFYKPSGEKVHCEPKCEQPPFDAGLCRASMLRYTFNSSSSRCEPFIWGGCGGNDNNFDSLEHCSSECETISSDICNLAPKPGPCRASMLRWHFNPIQQSCTQFDYGGCGGNANNFMSKEQCESRCPDLVLCPTITDGGSLTSCSRTMACANATCAGHLLDDFLCTVDPCSCSASLSDFNGHSVNCSELELASSSTTTSFDDDTTIMEVPTPLFSGQFLKLRPGTQFPTKTRCELMKEQSGGILSCDAITKQFLPRQCPPDNMYGVCFCVDDAGKQILQQEEQDSHDPNHCDHIPIAQVLVSLALPGGEENQDMSPVQLGVEMQQLLQLLGAQLKEDRVEIEVLPSATQLRFTLIGPYPSDISFWLESLVISNAIGVSDGKGVFHPASFATSTFTHEHQIKVEVDSEIDPNDTQVEITSTSPSPTHNDSENEIPFDEIVEKIAAERHLLENGDNTIGVLLTLVAAITAGLIVFGLFLAFQKKKDVSDFGSSGGSFSSKKPFGGIGAFSSGLYELEKKKDKKKKMAWREQVTIPTFRITPFYTTTAEPNATKT